MFNFGVHVVILFKEIPVSHNYTKNVNFKWNSFAVSDRAQAVTGFELE